MLEPRRVRIAGLARLDIAFAAVVLLAILMWGGADLDGLGRSLAVLACAALLWWQRFPVQIAVLNLGLLFVYYPLSDADGPLMLAFVAALYGVAAAAQLGTAVLLAAIAVVGFLLDKQDSGTPHLEASVSLLVTGWFAAAVAIGAVVHNRRAYLREVERHAVEAQRRQAEEMRVIAVKEWLRIARELHDALGHHVSLINVQAGAALHGMAARPERAGPALEAIKSTSHEALRELRAVLGVLRQADDAGQPGLDQVGDLIARARTAGLDVSLTVIGEPLPLGPEAGPAGYRVVQESLTNVTRHAAAKRAWVRMSYQADAVWLLIDDDGRRGSAAPVGSGSGLRGMAERVRALGGDFTAAPRPGGGFRVEARIPVQGEAQAA